MVIINHKLRVKGPNQSVPQNVRLKNKQTNPPSGDDSLGSERLNVPLQPDIPAALGDADADLAIGFLPTLADDVPVGEIVFGDGDLSLLRLARP